MVSDATMNHCQWEKHQNTHLRGGPITEYAHINTKTNKQIKKTTHINKQNKHTQNKTRKTQTKKTHKNPNMQTKNNKQKTQIKPNQANQPKKTQKPPLPNKKNPQKPKPRIHWTVQATVYGGAVNRRKKRRRSCKKCISSMQLLSTHTKGN